MKRVSCACLAAAVLAGAHLTLTAAETARLRYLASVYADANGAGLNQPEGVACNGNGQVVVGDTGNNRLIRFTYADKAVCGGTEIKIPQLSAPARVQLNSKGEIYALDGSWDRFTPAERSLFTVARKLAASPIVLTDQDVDEAVKQTSPREVVQLINYVTGRALFNRITEAAALPAQG